MVHNGKTSVDKEQAAFLEDLWTELRVYFLRLGSDPAFAENGVTGEYLINRLREGFDQEELIDSVTFRPSYFKSSYYPPRDVNSFDSSSLPNELFGTWRGYRDGPGKLTMLVEFSPEGIIRGYIAFRNNKGKMESTLIRGTYTANTKETAWTLDDGGKHVYSWRIENDVLYLENINSGERWELKTIAR